MVVSVPNRLSWHPEGADQALARPSTTTPDGFAGLLAAAAAQHATAEGSLEPVPGPLAPEDDVAEAETP